MLIPVQDVVFTQTIQQIELEIVNYVLNELASIAVHYLDTTGKSIKTQYVVIDGADFNEKWVTDDDLITLVCNRLGFIPLFAPTLLRQEAEIMES
jgi:hypothetical protein